MDATLWDKEVGFILCKILYMSQVLANILFLCQTLQVLGSYLIVHPSFMTQ
jgi:hypothetical protein